jgi:hypothetical protein
VIIQRATPSQQLLPFLDCHRLYQSFQLHLLQHFAVYYGLLFTDIVFEVELHNWSLDFIAGGHQKFSQTGDTQSQVNTSVSSQVESVEGHLCRRFADGLSSCTSDSFSRFYHASLVLQSKDILKGLPQFHFFQSLICFFRDSSQVVGWSELFLNSDRRVNLSIFLFFLKSFNFFSLEDIFKLFVFEFRLENVSIILEKVQFREEFVLARIERILSV